MLVFLELPFEPVIAGVKINIHLVLEYVAFFVGYRYYLRLRKRSVDTISLSNRLSIIGGAAAGALLGSRIVGLLENPLADMGAASFFELYNSKTIMGGLFGGMIGVEVAKKIIGETRSSGDLFTLPLIVGIFIGRVGCFLMGTNEFTYGTETTSITGMNLGDGLARHPIALYELAFLMVLFILLKRKLRESDTTPGIVFQSFMLGYFGFRFFIEFIKPNTFFLMGMSTIQWLCLVCFVYYRQTLTHFFIANKKVHVL